MNVFDKITEFAQRNYYVDVEDKIPIFLCSVGGHVFNTLNKCSRCDFDPDSPLVDEEEDFIIENCPLRHNNMPNQFINTIILLRNSTDTHQYGRLVSPKFLMKLFWS